MKSITPLLATQLSVWWWPLGLLFGVLVAAGSLSYTPSGRLNVLWLWLLWAGLPLLGALVSLGFMILGRDKPWLFRWRRQGLHWYPNRAQRWQMLWLLQAFWWLVGVGLLLGFGVLLLFSDLAFGWSSTLLAGDKALPFLQGLALPWQSTWPSAVPDTELMDATRYARIAPAANNLARAGDWWPFLLASLLYYNLLPRSLLAVFCWWRWRSHRRAQQAIAVTTGKPISTDESSLPPLQQAPLSQWQEAMIADWELTVGKGPHFGMSDWQQDEKNLDTLLARQPRQLLWRVTANRSPVGEMADLIARARDQGIADQGLLAVADSQTENNRHLRSWQQFARQQQLVWVTP